MQHIPPTEARLPDAVLHQFLYVRAITHAILVPAVLASLPAENLPALQVLVSGGAACSQHNLEG